MLDITAMLDITTPRMADAIPFVATQFGVFLG